MKDVCFLAHYGVLGFCGGMRLRLYTSYAKVGLSLQVTTLLCAVKMLARLLMRKFLKTRKSIGRRELVKLNYLFKNDSLFKNKSHT